jgi:pilus assembly protein FimV
MAVSEEQNQQETNHSVDESELEQYGVWVKAGPEDVIEAEAEDDGFTLDDLSEDALTDADNDFLVPDESPLDAEIADLSDEFEEISFDTLDDELDAGAFSDEMDQAELAIAAGERFEAVPEDELVELALDEDDVEQGGPEDEFEMLDLELDEEPTLPDTSEALADSDLLTLEEDDLTIDLGEESEELGLNVAEDLQIEPDAIPAEPVDGLDALGDLEDELILDDLAEDEAHPAASESKPVLQSAGSGDGIVDDDLNIEEDLPDDLDDLTLNLDDLDVDAFEEPMTGASEEPADQLGEPLDLESELIDLEEESLGTMEEVVDLDLSALPADDETFDEISLEELTQADEGELPELSGDEELTELTLDDMSLDEAFEVEIEPATPEMTESDTLELLDFDEESGSALEGDFLEEMDTDEDLLDLSDLAEDAADEAPAEVFLESAVAAPARETSDRSLSVLEKIERELSSIRSEIGDLKRELGELRGAPAAPAPTVDDDTDEDGTVGFFEGSEDEDETIALTGAELDNIMNTAEIVEETGQPTEIDDLISPADAPILDEFLLEADDETFPITEISLEESPEELDPIEIDLDSNDTVGLVGTEDEVEVLASMDIDAELADIEELEDMSMSLAEAAQGELADLDLNDGMPDLLDDTLIPDADLVLDTEPLNEAFVDGTSVDGAVVDDLDLMAEAELTVEPALPAESAIPGSITETEPALPDNLKSELRSVLSYMDQLLESLPEEKIQEFAQSDHFTVYRRLFEELGLEQ